MKLLTIDIGEFNALFDNNFSLQEMIELLEEKMKVDIIIKPEGE